MIVNTQRLFVNLLRTLQVSTVCDVGSMNGADALVFRAAVPHANVYAFEANPENFGRMQADLVLGQRNVQVVPVAVTNYDGDGEFFVVTVDTPTDVWRGVSSLYERAPRSGMTSRVVPVRTTRLDTFLVGKISPDERLALWIDAEGKTYEVIEGATSLASRTYLLHIEVETNPCIALNQKLYPEVKILLASLGFVELATDAPLGHAQLNAVFIRRDLPWLVEIHVRTWLAISCLRRFVGTLLGKVCPWCILRMKRAK